MDPHHEKIWMEQRSATRILKEINDEVVLEKSLRAAILRALRKQIDDYLLELDPAGEDARRKLPRRT